jgi:hypothetical protein
MLLNGVILVTDSKLNLEQSLESVKISRRKALKKMFKSVMALSVWALSEIFLVIVALIYFNYLYGKLPTFFITFIFFVPIDYVSYRYLHPKLKTCQTFYNRNCFMNVLGIF